MQKVIAALLSLLVLSFAAFPAQAGDTPPAPVLEAGMGTLGADTRPFKELLTEMGPTRVRENQLDEQQKRSEAQRLKDAIRNGQPAPNSLRPGGYSIGPTHMEAWVDVPDIGQSLVHSYDSWSNSPPTASAVEQVGRSSSELTKVPVDGRSRTCAHCGTAATLMVLRQSGNVIDDLSSDDGKAIFQLGVGWSKGGYSQQTHHIQLCCDGSTAPNTQYYNSIPQMQKVLRDRVTKFIYVVASKSNYTKATFTDAAYSNLSSFHPLIVSVNGRYLPYYQPDQGANNLFHIVVLNGYANDGESEVFMVTDPNDCSRVARIKPILGEHEVNADVFWSAMTGSFIW